MYAAVVLAVNRSERCSHQNESKVVVIPALVIVIDNIVVFMPPGSNVCYC